MQLKGTSHPPSFYLHPEERLENLALLPSFRSQLITPKLRVTWRKLGAFLHQEVQQGKVIFPPQNLIFSAFNITELQQIKVVIIGQDPYHGPGQAHGLAFSVLPGTPPPPSLVNIFKELCSDLSMTGPPTHHCLLPWAREGVLLLNTTLSVQQGQPLSHKNRGWEEITSALLQGISQQLQDVVFILWGRHAQTSADLIDVSRHHIITSSHPSPFSASRGFLGSRPFSRANAALISKGKSPINWGVLFGA